MASTWSPSIPDGELRSYALKNWFAVLKEFSNVKEYQIIFKLLNENLSINPTHALWRFLIDLNFLIIKRELLYVNPLNIPDVKIFSKEHGIH
jgi:hypothetical protein